MKRRKPIRRISNRQEVIKECDKLLFEILKLKRGAICEVCGRPNPAPHHVFFKGQYPRLRFREDNIVLMCWNPCHYALHHHTHDHPHYKRSYKRIKEIVGANYYDKLRMVNTYAAAHTPTYLNIIMAALRQELKELRGQ